MNPLRLRGAKPRYPHFYENLAQLFHIRAIDTQNSPNAPSATPHAMA